MAQGNSTALTVAEAHARLRAQADVQFDLATVQPTAPPWWLRWLAQQIGNIAPFAGWIFWTLIVVGVALILYLIVSTLIGRRANRDAQATPEQEIAAWRPEAKAARALLAEADALAADGNYDEAAHLLLHRSLEDIQRRRPRVLRPALTSREIAHVPALPDLVRGAFTTMAAIVERSLFGGRRLARSDWEEARTAYGEFALERLWK